MKANATRRALLLAVLTASKALGADARLPDSSDVTRGLALEAIELRPVYEADFAHPVRLVKEAALFEGRRRVRKPASDVDWVLEGKATVRQAGGQLYLVNQGGHLVFWNTRRFPTDFLLEFSVSPLDSRNGLNIVFFAASLVDRGSIFDLTQPFRDGVFKAYHSGQLNNYHVSYWAATSENGRARGTAHLRKNRGFQLVAAGQDFITGRGNGPHLVRILKLEGHIEVEVDGKIAIRWQDDGLGLGPVLQDGYIGLRQMAHTRECAYQHFNVWKASRR
jgi:hypothetical protein